MSKRRDPRFIRRLETEFSAEGKDYRAISSDFSCNGLFIRTRHACEPGTILSIRVHLPDGTPSVLKGRVRRALQTTIVSLKNGMGIELIEKDLPYINFMRGFTNEDEKTQEPEPKFRPVDILPATEKTAETPEPEPKFRPVDIPPVTEKTAETPEPDFVIISCPVCGVKNKVKTERLSQDPKCGKCGRLLPAT